MLLVTLKAGFSVRWFDMFLAYQTQTHTHTHRVFSLYWHQYLLKCLIHTVLYKRILEQGSKLDTWIWCKDLKQLEIGGKVSWWSVTALGFKNVHIWDRCQLPIAYAIFALYTHDAVETSYNLFSHVHPCPGFWDASYIKVPISINVYLFGLPSQMCTVNVFTCTSPALLFSLLSSWLCGSSWYKLVKYLLFFLSFLSFFNRFCLTTCGRQWLRCVTYGELAQTLSGFFCFQSPWSNEHTHCVELLSQDGRAESGSQSPQQVSDKHKTSRKKGDTPEWGGFHNKSFCFFLLTQNDPLHFCLPTFWLATPLKETMSPWPHTGLVKNNYHYHIIRIECVIKPVFGLFT